MNAQAVCKATAQPNIRAARTPDQAKIQLSVLFRLVKSTTKKKTSNGPAGINQVMVTSVSSVIQDSFQSSHRRLAPADD
jgi:hypothetical protein